MKNTNIAFIGGGNMATSLIGGLISDGYDADRIWAADPQPAQLDRLRSQFLIKTTEDNAEAAAQADVLVLAVKPQVMSQVVPGLAEALNHRNPLVVSIAAGITTDTLARWLGAAAPLIRAMPNTPALVGSGATAMFARDSVTESQRSRAESILRSVGVVTWVPEEKLMDAATALSGSGPAYFFYMMEALEEAGRGLGLGEQAARLLVLQTAMGAAKMALESNEDVSKLRVRVTSPGGTTEQAIKSLEDGDFKDQVDRAVNAAFRRAQELAQLLGSES